MSTETDKPCNCRVQPTTGQHQYGCAAFKWTDAELGRKPTSNPAAKKAVWKFELEIEDQFHVQMPEAAEILSVQVQIGRFGSEQVCAWALCPTDPEAPKAPRYFVCVGTGHDYVERYFHGLKFLGTVQLKGGALVFHYFEEPRGGTKT